MKKNWKYEIARDSMAFGSILFYLIVLVRSTIGEYMVFVYQLLIALAFLICEVIPVAAACLVP